MTKAKDCEFNPFPFITDIETVVLNHTELFNDAVVWCPFDTVYGSDLWKFMHENFERLGLRELISTGLGQPFIATYTGGDDSDVSVFDTVPIDGDGSYDSEDFLPLRECCTIIADNPPFSLYSDISELVDIFERSTNQRFGRHLYDVKVDLKLGGVYKFQRWFIKKM